MYLERAHPTFLTTLVVLVFSDQIESRKLVNKFSKFVYSKYTLEKKIKQMFVKV